MTVPKSASTETRQAGAKGSLKRWPIIILVAILLIAGGLAVFAALGAFGKMMTMPNSSKTQFDTLAISDPVQLVFEITSIPSDKQLVGNLVESASDNVYHRTAETLTVTVAPDVNIVMGQTTDIKPGAVIQVQGRRTDTRSVAAQRIVILTGYVNVQ